MASAMSSSNGDTGDEARVLEAVTALRTQLDPDNHATCTMDSRLSGELGLDSLAIVELCDRLEGLFHVTLNDDVLLDAATPRDWLVAIQAAQGYHPMSPSAPGDAVARDERGGDTARRRSARRRESGSRRSSRAKPGDRSRSLTMSLYVTWACLVIVPFATAILTLAALPMRLARRIRLARRCARLVCSLLRIEVVAVANLPVGGPFVIVANHSSFIDGLVLFVALDESVVYVSSVELERQLFLGLILRRFGCRFVERGRPNRGASPVGELVDVLRSHQSLVIFPEGSLDEVAGLRAFHLGAFEAACSMNCAVVPLGIRGSREVLSPGSFEPRPGRVTITMGAPLAPSGVDFNARVALRDATRAAVKDLCEIAADL